MKRRRNSFKKFYYVYVTTNKINGSQYIGDHSTDNLEDNYLGSGNLILAAIKKYGKENFDIKILEHCKSKKHAYDCQEKYINEYHTLTPNGYNISRKGGIDPCSIYDSEENLKKYIESLKHVHYSPDFDRTIHIQAKH